MKGRSVGIEAEKQFGSWLRANRLNLSRRTVIRVAGFEDEEDKSNINESNIASVTENLDVNRANGAIQGSVLVMDNNNGLGVTETERSASQGIETVKDNGN